MFNKIKMALLLSSTIFFTSCDTSWIAPLLDGAVQLVNSLTRGDEAASVTKISKPTFTLSRGDVSAEQSSFFGKIKTVQFTKFNNVGDDVRAKLNSKFEENVGNSLTKFCTDGNSCVYGKMDGEQVKDVLIVKDNAKTIEAFGVEGTFSKTQIESLTKSGEIYNTLNYLNK